MISPASIRCNRLFSTISNTPRSLMRPFDVLILGAGPAGAASAIRAARAGLSCALVDRARFPRDKPCSEYMSPETVRHLDQLGVLPELERAGGVAIAGTTIVTGPRGSALTGLFARAGTRRSWPPGSPCPAASSTRRWSRRPDAAGDGARGAHGHRPASRAGRGGRRGGPHRRRVHPAPARPAHKSAPSGPRSTVGAGSEALTMGPGDGSASCAHATGVLLGRSDSGRAPRQTT